jgi:hypothetical protein
MDDGGTTAYVILDPEHDNTSARVGEARRVFDSDLLASLASCQGLKSRNLGFEFVSSFLNERGEQGKDVCVQWNIHMKLSRGRAFADQRLPRICKQSCWHEAAPL